MRVAMDGKICGPAAEFCTAGWRRAGEGMERGVTAAGARRV